MERTTNARMMDLAVSFGLRCLLMFAREHLLELRGIDSFTAEEHSPVARGRGREYGVKAKATMEKT